MHLKLYILFLTVVSVYLAFASPVPKEAQVNPKRDDINVPAIDTLYKRADSLYVWVEFCEEEGKNCVGHINPYNNKCFTIFGKKKYIRFHSKLLLDRDSFTLNTASLEYQTYCPKNIVAAQTFDHPQNNTLLEIDHPGVKYYFSYPY
ncbi:uncharacterized protein FA14DRAFT_159228 [Meira miltonrushii]|uniref:Uncharacterized protein n=1 Tax=Meira miltonrushii TaxID=1280837 RepID=A0A316VLJ7_9BASI|nr:uncharacterized protein FA14DRAFT_159228 [Meira miltonrushii]PWN36961.1 hypothetical protein FA14DRAFT_159228 [Meira miltonrushii]